MLSVSAVNARRIPSAKSIPSTLYPRLPSTVLNASVVNVSMTSIFFLAVIPELNSFIPATNSIMGRVAR